MLPEAPLVRKFRMHWNGGGREGWAAEGENEVEASQDTSASVSLILFFIITSLRSLLDILPSNCQLLQIYCMYVYIVYLYLYFKHKKRLKKKMLPSPPNPIVTPLKVSLLRMYSIVEVRRI